MNSVSPFHEPLPLLAALDVVLDAIEAPAFVVGQQGELLHANASAQMLLDHDAGAVTRSLAATIAGTPDEFRWELRPLRGADAAPGFLAILRVPVRRNALARLVRAACVHWRLTARQAQVLELVADGLTTATIGRVLAISIGTVEFHLAALFNKAGVDNRVSLIVRLIEL